jgi:uncharacterized protein YjbJ (UPF0337 family)
MECFLYCRTAFFTARLLVEEQEERMNWDQVQGKWKQMTGEVKTRWGKLTDDDLKVIGGERDKLVGRIQERYGIAKEQAQKEVDEWNTSLGRENEYERERTEKKAS